MVCLKTKTVKAPVQRCSEDLLVISNFKFAIYSFLEHLLGQVLLIEIKQLTSNFKQLTSGSNVTDCWKAFTAPVRSFVFIHAQPKENPTPG